MSRRNLLEERVLILEQCLSRFEPTMSAQFAAADMEAESRFAEIRLYRLLRNVRVASLVVPSVMWLLAPAFLWID